MQDDRPRAFAGFAAVAILAFGAVTLLANIHQSGPLSRVTERLVSSGRFQPMDLAWGSDWSLTALEDAPWTASTKGAVPIASVDPDKELLVINLWASWCPPCRNELPGMMKLARKLRDKPVRFVFVTYDSAWDMPGALLKELFHGFPPDVAMVRDTLAVEGADQPADTMWKRLGATALPETFFVKGGVVTAKVVGEIDWGNPDVEEWLRLVIGG